MLVLQWGHQVDNFLRYFAMALVPLVFVLCLVENKRRRLTFVPTLTASVTVILVGLVVRGVEALTQVSGTFDLSSFLLLQNAYFGSALLASGYGGLAFAIYLAAFAPSKQPEEDVEISENHLGSE
jgi:hypothetical protein